MYTKNKIRILLSTYDPIENDPRAQRNIEVLEELILSENNHSIDVLSPKIVSIGSIEYYKISKFLFNRNKFPISTNLFFCLYILFKIFKLRPKIIFASNFSVLPPSFLGAKIIRSKIIYDSYELLIPKVDSKQNFHDWIYYFFEKIFIKHIDFTIAANSERALIMQNFYHLKFSPVSIRNLPSLNKNFNSFNQRKFGTDNEIINDFLSGKKRIIYAGLISFSRGLLSFINAFLMLPNDFKCLIIGTGPDFDLLIEFIKQNKIENVKLLGRIPSSEIPDHLKLGHVGIISYSWADQNNIFCSPNKIFEYALANLPVISTSQPPLKSLIEKYNIGECIPRAKENNIQYIAETISLIFENYNNYTLNIPKFLEDHSWELEKKKLKNAIEPILKN